MMIQTKLYLDKRRVKDDGIFPVKVSMTHINKINKEKVYEG